MNLDKLPKEQVNDMFEYFSNIKLLWNRKDINLTKKELNTMTNFFKEHNKLFGNEKYLDWRTEISLK